MDSDPSDNPAGKPEDPTSREQAQREPEKTKTTTLKDQFSRVGNKIYPSRAIERFRTLLRTLGLAVLTFRRRQYEEPPKVLLESSIWVALARCAIHVGPALVSVVLVTLNLKGFFIGSELQGPVNQDGMKMGLLQIAAKVQELLVVASVGAIIFHILGSELVFGEGVPLGLLVSGWSFSQIQYFWSAEFLGGLGCSKTMPRKQRWQRRAFILFIVIGGALALIAGPAAALLMIPREIDWAVGGGIYWLNGSDEQLWPTNLTAEFYSEIDGCIRQDRRFQDTRCPSAGFSSLYQYFSWGNHLNAGFSFELRDFNMRKTMYSLPSLRPEANTWSFTAHAPTARLQDAMRGLHHGALMYLQAHRPFEPPFPRHLDWANPTRFEVETKVPAVRVFCQPHEMNWLWGENLTVGFSSIHEYDDWWEIPSASNFPAPKEIDVLKPIQEHLAARGILNDSLSLLHGESFQHGRRTLIFPIEAWDLTNNSLDLVVLLGETWAPILDGKPPAEPSNLLSCAVDARWVEGKTVMEMRPNAHLGHEYHSGRVRNLVNTESDSSKMGYARFKPPDDGSWPVIRLSASWFNMLSPTLPAEPVDWMPWMSSYGTNQTTMEALFNMLYDPATLGHWWPENMLATVMADGLSRCGLIPNHNGSLFLEAWPFTDWTIKNESMARKLVRQGPPEESFQPTLLEPGSRTRMVMKATYRGLVMEASGWFDYLSIAALLVHALIALAHCCLLLKSRTTSGAWDTVLELVVLTTRSEPPPELLLANTSAGVRSFKTVKLLASVEAPHGRSTGVFDAESLPQGELQMRLRDPAEKRNPSLRPEEVGQVYGTASHQ